jgi:anhydro-N-acetylmuramic acid kinase
MKNNFKVLGIMSGTSLDGLDLALCDFKKDNGKWSFTILKSSLVKYPSRWSERLHGAFDLSAHEYLKLDVDYGKFLGDQCKKFLSTIRAKPDFISSHGHTIFHQPSSGFTAQIGNGNMIHAVTGLPVVFDLRSLDVSLKGQGAPLVPAGDKYLFSGYDICLNLGGIANLSADINGERKAYDICFCNMPMNMLMEQTGKRYDKNGALAAEGEVNDKLLASLRRAYKPLRKRRPSLGKEIFLKSIEPLLKGKSPSRADKLATLVESASEEIALAAKETGGRTMMCTGGGAFNSFLMSRILEHCGDNVSIIVPDTEVVKYKEAMVFAFLGVLRVCNEINSFRSVTGAFRDSSGGVMVGFDNAMA